MEPSQLLLSVAVHDTRLLHVPISQNKHLAQPIRARHAWLEWALRHCDRSGISLIMFVSTNVGKI